MPRIVIADTTSRYDGRSLATQPLGGTESSVCHMAAALARRGHAITCYTNCDAPIEHDGVAWRPLDGARPIRPELYVAVQHPRLLGFARSPRRRAIWLTWRPNNLRHHKQLGRMWFYRPRVLFISAYQAGLYSRLLPPAERRLVVPHGLPEQVRGRMPLVETPPPHAIFASNPSRSLAWLINLWTYLVRPRVPGGKLLVYGIRGKDWRYGEPWREADLDLGLPPSLAEAARDSVELRPTATREDLWAAMRASRTILYGGHESEMFCLTLAEAQALGVPAVIRPVAVLPERVRDGQTGFIRADDAGFADAAVALLTDDALWRRQHEAALRQQQGFSWAECAAAFERALLD